MALTVEQANRAMEAADDKATRAMERLEEISCEEGMLIAAGASTATMVDVYRRMATAATRLAERMEALQRANEALDEALDAETPEEREERIAWAAPDAY